MALSRVVFGAHINTELEAREKELRRQALGRKKNNSFMGLRRVQKQDPWSTPRRQAEEGEEAAAASAGDTLNPRFAARDKWRRLEIVRRMKDFINAYRQALAAWRGGAILGRATAPETG